MSLSENIKNFVIEWNIKYPFDYIWRKRNNVSFGSEEHKRMSHLDMVIELYEENYIKRMIREAKEAEEDKIMEEFIGRRTNNTQQVIKMSKKDIDDEFDDLDYTQFNDNGK